MINDFTFIGYSIRKVNVPSAHFHKPDCTMVTMDDGMSPFHKILDRNWKREGLRLSDDSGYYDLHYSFSDISALYASLSQTDRMIYGVFGYSIANSDYRKFYNGFLNVDLVDNKLVSLSETPNYSNMEFCGFDVIDSESVWLSTLIDCEIDWMISEKCGDLNKNHLFSEHLSAQKFAEKCEQLVQEHSPCAVWAIWKIEKIE